MGASRWSDRMSRRSLAHLRLRRAGRATLAVAATAMCMAALSPAAAGAAPAPTLDAASYPDMTTYLCRTNAIPIYPGQNTNLFAGTKTCPNAQVVSGPGDAGVFAPG